MWMIEEVNMEIVQDRALVVRTRNPAKITEVIPKSAVMKEVTLPNGLGYEVAVKWTLPNNKNTAQSGLQKSTCPDYSPV